MKHKKKLFAIYVLAMLSLRIFGQSLSPSLICTAGNYSTNTTHSMQWNIGDLLVNTQRNSTHIMTQGFEQVNLSIINTNDAINNSLFVFSPNPVTQTLNIAGGDGKIINQINLIDMQGKTLLTKMHNGSTVEVDFSQFPVGVYIVQIKHENRVISKKVIKK
jgi:hypothetical protein